MGNACGIAALGITLAGMVGGGCGGGQKGAQPRRQIATGETPTVRLGEDDQITWERLPALSADGTRVALLVTDMAGAPGPLTYALELRDTTTDKPVVTIVLLSAEEAMADFNETNAAYGDGQPYDEEAEQERPAPPRTDPHARLTARVAQANAELAKTQWQALAPLTMTPSDDDWDRVEPRTAAAGTVVIAYAEPKLTITDGGQVRVDRAATEWSVKPYDAECGDNPPDDCIHCENNALFDAAWIDADRSVAVVGIRYVGSDSCWEPMPALHVVPLDQAH